MSHGTFPLSPATRTPPRAGKSEETTPQRGRRSPMCHNVARHSYCSTALLQHCIVKLIARNRRFSVDLSGARPRRLKSEFLSIMQKHCYTYRTESPHHSGFVGRPPATLEKRIPINHHPNRDGTGNACIGDRRSPPGALIIDSATANGVETSICKSNELKHNARTAARPTSTRKAECR